MFRPRWSWELSAAAGEVEQYIDGGVMDNLPIDAIAQFLHRAAQTTPPLVGRRPRAPHLVIAASLEEIAPAYATSFTRRRFRTSWPALTKRAKQLGYNGKLNLYSHAERALRQLDDDAARDARMRGVPHQSDLVHIQLLAIKPNWLCNTFGFHPMLGYKRRKQAESIAHGCASTLLQFAGFATDVAAQDFEDWGMQTAAIPEFKTWSSAFARLEDWKDNGARKGLCWMRDRVCPFSAVHLRTQHSDLPEAIIKEIAVIHTCCGDRRTHLRPI